MKAAKDKAEREDKLIKAQLEQLQNNYNDLYKKYNQQSMDLLDSNTERALFKNKWQGCLNNNVQYCVDEEKRWQPNPPH